MKTIIIRLLLVAFVVGEDPWCTVDTAGNLNCTFWSYGVAWQDCRTLGMYCTGVTYNPYFQQP